MTMTADLGFSEVVPLTVVVDGDDNDIESECSDNEGCDNGGHDDDESGGENLLLAAAVMMKMMMTMLMLAMLTSHDGDDENDTGCGVSGDRRR